MPHTSRLVNMKLSKADREQSVEMARPAEDAPRYPWGLSLSLDNESLEKLGIETLPDVDEELLLYATVKVTRVSSADAAEGGKSRDVGLQITAMSLMEKGSRARTADVLFGAKKE